MQKIIQLGETDSTNEEAKRLVKSAEQPSALDGTAIIAKEQTAGKGRLGKPFFSPKGDSLYISFIFKAPEGNWKPDDITIPVSCIVFEAIQNCIGAVPGLRIKPINDLLIGDRKICGILTEGLDPKAQGRPTVVIIGIGLNINLDMNAVPDELKSIVGSLRMRANQRDELLEVLITKMRGKFSCGIKEMTINSLG
jgi:BirA family biotin operon repressor/biotin-[acetyl-CoA-carboxylase] ligase